MKMKNIIVGGVRIIFASAGAAALIFGIAGLTENQGFDGRCFSIMLTAFISLAVTFIPDFAAEKNILIMPAGLQALFSGFIFGSVFLGEILDFYTRFSWWDTMLHFISGILFSLTAYMLFLSLCRDRDIRRQISPAVTVLFAVCFSAACGIVWEIFEFGADSLLGMNMQRWQSGMSDEQRSALQNISNYSNPGLVDTMKDIISDVLGSVFSVLIILPLARHSNKYKKVSIPLSTVLDEYKGTLAGVRASERTLKKYRPGHVCSSGRCGPSAAAPHQAGEG